MPDVTKPRLVTAAELRHQDLRVEEFQRQNPGAVEYRALDGQRCWLIFEEVMPDSEDDD
jgi:hypothetical protein